jgi:hypothetical protein
MTTGTGMGVDGAATITINLQCCCNHLTNRVLSSHLQLPWLDFYFYITDCYNMKPMAQAQLAFHEAIALLGFSNPAINTIMSNRMNSTQDLIGIESKDI